MKEYLSTVQISASPAEVWAVLGDGPSYAQWNPEIVKIDGEFAAGGTVTAHVRLGSGAVRVLRQKVVDFSAPNRMEWVSGLPFGLFTGRRIYTVAPKAGGSEFQLKVQMSGLVSGPILKSVGDRQPELDSFSHALKKTVEARRQPG